MESNHLYVTIMAGGLGKRMQSQLPKVLHKVSGIPMIVKILNEVKQLNPLKILIIVGQFKEIICETINNYIKIDNIEYVMQETPLGSGHAVLCSLNNLNENGFNLIVNGDNPMLTHKTLSEAIHNFKQNEFELQITAINAKNPIGCGRIILENDIFQKIIEEKDCDEEQKKINLINTGIYLASNIILKKYIPLIKNENKQNEYYLTDIVEIYKNNVEKIIGLFIIDSNKELEVININTKEQLEELNNKLK